jgi:hypothetical protein
MLSTTATRFTSKNVYNSDEVHTRTTHAFVGNAVHNSNKVYTPTTCIRKEMNPNILAKNSSVCVTGHSRMVGARHSGLSVKHAWHLRGPRNIPITLSASNREATVADEPYSSEYRAGGNCLGTGWWRGEKTTT